MFQLLLMPELEHQVKQLWLWKLGADGVLLNTAVAQSKNPAQMALAMNLGVQAGRLAYLAGRMDKKNYATASSPLDQISKLLNLDQHH
jgi:thiazole synthase ThiGH ThiG subunit